MGFSKQIKEDVLVASARHCCVCHRYKGVKIEVHHILPKEQGGLNTFENAIPLCFDCHSDAGHYHAKHPKGTKFSIEELKKHKVNWFSIVNSNSIPRKRENQIHARYIITKEFDLIKDICKRDLSRFPIKNCLLFENDSLAKFRTVFANQTDRRLDIENLIQLTPKAYKANFPDAIDIERPEGEYNTFYHQRIPSKTEISTICKHDSLSIFLSQNNISPEKIAKINTCFESECGGNGSFEELYQLRPLYFKFLVLTNISGKYIKPQSLIALKHDGVLYTTDEINQRHTIKFPKISIEPNQSILIPLGIFLANFKDLEKTDNYIRINEQSGDRSIVFDHTIQNKNQDIEYCGINYGPESIKFERSNEDCVQDIHVFDFENLYWIDGFWNCGSCPHLFYIDTNQRIIYKGELFNTFPDTETTIFIKIEKNIRQLVVSELEHELTTIKSIYKNGVEIFTNVHLVTGQDLRINVNESDNIEITGFYSVSTNSSMKLPISEKYYTVEKYKTNYDWH